MVGRKGHHRKASGTKNQNRYNNSNRRGRANSSNNKKNQQNANPSSNNRTGSGFAGCFKCGMMGHKAHECRNGITCFNCGQKGHKAPDCKALKKQQHRGGGTNHQHGGGANHQHHHGGGGNYHGGGNGHGGKKPDSEKMCYKCGKMGHVRSNCNETRDLANKKLPEPQKKRIAQNFKSLPRDRVKMWLPQELEHVVEIVRLCECLVSTKCAIKKLEMEIIDAGKEKKTVTFRRMSDGSKVELPMQDNSKEALIALKLQELSNEVNNIKRCISVHTDELFACAENAESTGNLSFVPDAVNRSANVQGIVRSLANQLENGTPAADRIAICAQWVHTLLRETNRVMLTAVQETEDLHMVKLAKKAAAASTAAVMAAGSSNRARGLPDTQRAAHNQTTTELLTEF